MLENPTKLKMAFVLFVKLRMRFFRRKKTNSSLPLLKSVGNKHLDRDSANRSTLSTRSTTSTLSTEELDLPKAISRFVIEKDKPVTSLDLSRFKIRCYASKIKIQREERAIRKLFEKLFYDIIDHYLEQTDRLTGVGDPCTVSDNTISDYTVSDNTCSDNTDTDSDITDTDSEWSWIQRRDHANRWT